MPENDDERLWRELQKLYDTEEKTIEHVDYGTKTHYGNEALGDIYRELTTTVLPPSDEYAKEKLDRLDTQLAEIKRLGNPASEWHAMFLQQWRDNVQKPENAEKHAKFLEGNAKLREETARARIESDRKEVLVSLLDAQRDFIRCAREEIPFTKCSKSIRDAKKKVADFMQSKGIPTSGSR